MKDIERLKEILTFDEKVFILPHYGEFGWLVIRIMRLMHIVKAPEKIICCHPGEEIYYPSADEFYYDWKNSIPNRKIKGYYTSLEDKKQLISKIKKKYHDYKIVDFSTIPIEDNFNFADIIRKIGLDFCRRLESVIIKNIRYKLNPKINNIKTDVVFGARKRSRSSGKNWKYWNKLGELLKKKGLSYSVAGVKDQSYFVEGAICHAWQYESPSDASVEMIQNCSLYIGSDTGTTHLASFIQKPIITVGYQPKLDHSEYLSDSNGGYNIIHANSQHFEKDFFKQIMREMKLIK